MSEEEKIKRDLYKKSRDKKIAIQTAIIALVTVLTIVFSLVYNQLNKTYYIGYTEAGNVDYRVYLKENDFFEEEYLGKGQAYIASLIDKIAVDFYYNLSMDTPDVNYDYSYSIDAELEIFDEHTDKTLYRPLDVKKDAVTASKNSSSALGISEHVEIDYAYYNDRAQDFIETYGLESTRAALILRMNVNVLSECPRFENDSENKYVIALNIPLTERTINIQMSTNVPSGEQKALACGSATNKNAFLITAISLGVIDLLLIAILVLFVYNTRNRDINYTIMVKKLLSAYKSYIQQINNEFDVSGYRVLNVNTFNEMLEIRDTIQSPILMSENEDKTCTKFIITTNTDILYVFEIKVEGYDEIYSTIPLSLDYLDDSSTEETAENTATDNNAEESV